MSSNSLDELYKEYLTNAKNAKSHIAKNHVLSKMLEDFFELTTEEIIKGIEIYLRGRVYKKNINAIKRGRIDLLLPDVIVELKVDFNNTDGNSVLFLLQMC